MEQLSFQLSIKFQLAFLCKKYNLTQNIYLRPVPKKSLLFPYTLAQHSLSTCHFCTTTRITNLSIYVPYRKLPVGYRFTFLIYK